MMFRVIAGLVILLSFVDSSLGRNLPSDVNEKYKVVCYYTNWAQYRPNGGKFYPENINANLCTHVVYAFAKMVNGRLAPFEWNDDSTSWSKGMYQRVNDLKKKNPSLKTLIAVGGWNMGSAPFTAMVASPQSRKKFIDHAIRFLRNRGFDGLDIDWEYPGSRGSPVVDKQRFIALIKELREAFEDESSTSKHDRLLVTAAVPAGKGNIDRGYDIPALTRYLDFINLMAYDLHGSWEPFTGHNSPLYSRSDETGNQKNLNQAWSVDYWLSKGAERSKLILGMALYGRSFTLANSANFQLGKRTTGPGTAGQFTRQAGILSYYEICQKVSSGWTKRWHDEQRVPYAHRGKQWVGYDDPQSIAEKTAYLMRNNLGGAMVWALDFDDFQGRYCNQGKYPLLKRINSVLNGQSGGTSTTIRPTQGDRSTTFPATIASTSHKPNTSLLPVTPTLSRSSKLPSTTQESTERPTAQSTIELTTPSIGTTTSRVRFECPRFRQRAPLYPDPNNCSKYYQCVYIRNRYIRSFHRNCAPGTVFNPRRKLCDFPRNVRGCH
ncbi:unnamed protein product [Owenia fusiformis]|uniref:Uncharacterized protein n=1 Tax=Owenia fusiformis TaxID=6347 RepID=A0A8J1U5L1_OWEFU|nr:unnamed protein product [Owenia fusiformis]